MTAAEKISPGLQAYPTYKDSGVAWIGEIPVGWEVRRIKEMTRFEVGGTPPTNETEHFEGDLPWVTIADMQGDDLGDTKLRLTSEAVHKYRIPLVKKGDLLMSFKLSVGKTAFAPCDLYTNEAIATFSGTEQMDLRYLYYVLPHAVLESAGENIYGAKILNQRLIRSTPLPVPPREDQTAIATVLDRETARIDKLLREQGLLLEDLGLKRTATINDATQALPGVQLDLIPTDWQLVPLKSLMASMEQGWSPQCENRPAGEGEWGVLKVGCVNGRRFNPEENKALPVDLDPLPRYALKRDDVLVSRANTRDLVGSAARVEQDYPQLLLCDKLYRLRPDHSRLLPDYLVFLLGSPLARGGIEMAASGASASMVNISQGTVKNLLVPLPPLETQRTILAHLDAQLAQIDALTEEVRASMTLMRQHRAALITAAVTGKIDVRNHA